MPQESSRERVGLKRRHFLIEPLSEPGQEWREVEMARLVEFFSHPTKFFVRHRLGIELPREREEMEDREPFTLHSLDRYDIEQQLLDDALDGVGPEGALDDRCARPGFCRRAGPAR